MDVAHYVDAHQLQHVMEKLSQCLLMVRPPNPRAYTQTFLRDSIHAWPILHRLRSMTRQKQLEYLGSVKEGPVAARLAGMTSIAARMELFREAYKIAGWVPNMQTLVGVTSAAAAKQMLGDMRESLQACVDLAAGHEGPVLEQFNATPRLATSTHHLVLATQSQRMAVVSKMIKSGADPHDVDPTLDFSAWEADSIFLKTKCAVAAPPKRMAFQSMVFKWSSDKSRSAIVDTVRIDAANMELQADIRSEDPRYQHNHSITGVIVREFSALYRDYPSLRCRGPPSVGCMITLYDANGVEVTAHPMNVRQKDFGKALRVLLASAKERMDRMNAMLPVF